MQTGRAPIKDTTMSKPRLLLLTSAIVIGALAVPVILPHITQPSLIYHILLHVLTVIITLFLSIVSIMSYNRTNNSKVLLMALGFLSLVAAEVVHLLGATQSLPNLIIPIVNIELSHIILLTMVSMIGLGVLKVNK